MALMLVSGVGITNLDIIYSGLNTFPKLGTEAYAKGLSIQLGGGVPATLINLYRLGVPVRLATFIGKGLLADYIHQQLQNYGVEYHDLYSGEGIPFSLTSVAVTKQDRTFLSYRESVDLDDYTMESVYNTLKGSDVVIMSEGYIPVYRKLKKEGTKLVLDFGWDDEISLQRFDEYLKLADYYTPNRKEAKKITNTVSEEDALQRLGDYFEYPIVKLDKEGCLVGMNGKPVLIAPYSEYKHVDSTGAGDAFLAGFIYGICHEFDILRSVRAGNLTGGACVAKTGALNGFIKKEELNKITEAP
jgi:sugar/nucleoside kinase (ribokinase family)